LKETTKTRSTFISSSIALGAAVGAVTALARYVRAEIARRGYSSWEECRCEFKTQRTIFQVWHSTHERRGETIVAQEWGIYLIRPAHWLRRFLHHSTQVIAVLNPTGRYVERILLTPQEAHQLAALLHTGPASEEADEPISPEQAYIAWRSEVLHFPRYLFDACVRRLYPAHIAAERLKQAEHLPVLWDPLSNLPLPTAGPHLVTPTGTRIDCIGWTPAQVSYCTARLK